MTPNELASKLAGMEDEIARQKDFIEIPALKELEGSMKQRIHNKGQDYDGTRIGIKSKRAGLYSPGYERFKAKKVGQANLYPINLQLSGDLLKDYTVGKENGENVIKFQTESARLKAGVNEGRYNTEVFRPSSQELEDLKEVYLDGLKRAIQGVFD